MPATSCNAKIHQGDTVEEKISLSERFGLWLSFHPFTQDEYLEIVRYWLEKLNAMPSDWSQARLLALRLHWSADPEAGGWLGSLPRTGPEKPPWKPWGGLGGQYCLTDVTHRFFKVPYSVGGGKGTITVACVAGTPIWI